MWRMLWRKSDAKRTLRLCHGHSDTSSLAWKCVLCITGPLGSVWTRYYCTYQKSSKMFTMSNTESRPASRQVSSTDQKQHQCSMFWASHWNHAVLLRRPFSKPDSHFYVSYLPHTEPFVNVLAVKSTMKMVITCGTLLQNVNVVLMQKKKQEVHC